MGNHNNSKISKIIFWLDSNVNNQENTKYQKIIKAYKNTALYTFTDINICISNLMKIKFMKTYIMISGSLSQEFFIEFVKIINKIKTVPSIIIFTSKEKFRLIKTNILNLKNFSLFDIKLVFANFKPIHNYLNLENIYKPKNIGSIKSDEIDNCFSFEYIKELKDLIFPLIFFEYIDNPNDHEIISFNRYLLDKYSSNKKMKYLIDQLFLKVRIPIDILVKYWLRAYTNETNFYREMNYYLERKKGNEYDIYIRALYQGLITKSISPLINKTLYRGAKIKKMN